MLFHTDTVQLSAEYYDQLQRRNYVTPTSYLELINTFKSLLQPKRAEVINYQNKLIIYKTYIIIVIRGVKNRIV